MIAFSITGVITVQPNNVLLPMRLPTQKELRAAVAKIIRAVQLEYGELLAMLPDLKAAQAAISNLILKAERIAA